MGVNSLPKTVTRQRRGCDLNAGPSAPESSTLTARLTSHPGVGLPLLVLKSGFRAVCATICSQSITGFIINSSRPMLITAVDVRRAGRLATTPEPLDAIHFVNLSMTLAVPSRWRGVRSTEQAGSSMTRHESDHVTDPANRRHIPRRAVKIISQQQRWLYSLVV